MSVVAVVPARLGATRLARKPLRLVGGVPLVVRVSQRVAALGVADHVVVATDSDEVRDVCAAHGVDVRLTSVDHPSGTDRVAEVAALPEFTGARVVVNVQGDEPFVTGEAIRAAIAPVAGGRYAIGTVATPAAPDLLHDPAAVKVVLADDGRALYFSRAPIPFLRDADDAAWQRPLVRRHIGVYAYTPEALAAWVALPPHPLELVERLEQLRPLAAGLPIGVGVVDAAFPAGVDTAEDLLRADAHARALDTADGTRHGDRHGAAATPFPPIASAALPSAAP